MADTNRIKELQTEIDAVLAYKSKQLITRPDWGTMTFKKAEQDINANLLDLGYASCFAIGLLDRQCGRQDA